MCASKLTGQFSKISCQEWKQLSALIKLVPWSQRNGFLRRKLISMHAWSQKFLHCDSHNILVITKAIIMYTLILDASTELQGSLNSLECYSN